LNGRPDMLDRVKPLRGIFRTAFSDWWRAQSPAFQESAGYSVAKTIFRAGYASGHNRDLRRFIFKAGRLRITVWATGVGDARRKAMAEADYRAAERDWKIPKSGWKLEELR
jgi:hypothetical protein